MTQILLDNDKIIDYETDISIDYDNCDFRGPAVYKADFWFNEDDIEHKDPIPVQTFLGRMVKILGDKNE